MTKGFDSSWQENIYSHQKHINRYPFGELVSHVMRIYSEKLRSHESLKALDLGCGTGNNLAFLAAEGFEAYGIDGSERACQMAKKFLESKSLKADIQTGDLKELPYESNFFDLVVDREAIYCNRIDTIRQISSEVLRVIKPGGCFLSFCFSMEHGAAEYKEKEFLEPQTYTNFKHGSFAGTGLVHFFSLEEVKEVLFKGFKIDYIKRHLVESIFPKTENEYAEFIICGRKT